MTRPSALAAVLLVAALAGCTKSGSGPQESVVATSAPTLVAESNGAWRSTEAGGLLKIVVVNVTATSRMDVSWHDVLLNMTDAPLAPSTAFVRGGNFSYVANDTYRLDADRSLTFELHYKGNSTEEPTHGMYDFPSGPVVFALPPPLR